MADTTLYANPYNPDHAGFYFTDLTEYEAGRDRLNKRGCEEWEIDYVDGDDAELFRACGVDQSNIHSWFEDVQELEDHEKAAVYYLTSSLGYTLEDALKVERGGYRQFEDYSVFEGTAEEYAEEYIESCGLLDSMPENLRCYFDVEKFAQDMQYNGDVTEFTLDGRTWTASA